VGQFEFSSLFALTVCGGHLAVVILSAAKDLLFAFLLKKPKQVLRCAQDDNVKKLRMTTSKIHFTKWKNQIAPVSAAHPMPGPSPGHPQAADVKRFQACSTTHRRA